VEVTGPSATDVHHNFVQRWNEASERTASDGVWGHNGGRDDDLAFPDCLSGARGNSLVQIQGTADIQASPIDAKCHEQTHAAQHGAFGL
jgi:phosphatidylserine/phosphatidylglycerophosphate/cardiolipin synthase-like enzyme